MDCARGVIFAIRSDYYCETLLFIVGIVIYRGLSLRGSLSLNGPRPVWQLLVPEEGLAEHLIK
jgi:hypothetical protein